MRTSRLLVLLNRLKAEARRDWLTGSQSTALANIEQLWRFPERVNLCGAPGVGKTFLAWSVARALCATFYASPRIYQATASPGQERVVIENAPDNVTDLRRLLATVQLNGVRTALFVTKHPNRLGLPTVTLPIPTTQDVDTIYRNLSLLDYYAPHPTYSNNLWAVVAQV
jgi:hypothetical protein